MRTIYIHGENNPDIRQVNIQETEGHAVLKEFFMKEFQIPGSPDDYLVYAQEDDFFPDGEEVVTTEIALVHLSHVHFHRCKKITVNVNYNGATRDLDFNPGATGKKVRKKVLHEFGIKEADATKLFLKTTGEVRVQATDHIGSFAGHHDCKVYLLLVSEKLIEG